MMKAFGFLLILFTLNVFAACDNGYCGQPYYTIDLSENYDGRMFKDNKPYSGYQSTMTGGFGSPYDEKLDTYKFEKGYLTSHIIWHHSASSSCKHPCGVRTSHTILSREKLTLKDYKNKDAYNERHLRYQSLVTHYHESGEIWQKNIWMNDNIDGSYVLEKIK